VYAKEVNRGIAAEAYAVLDVTSGRLLYASNAHTRLRIASLTKVMTAIVALDHGDVRDIVRISDVASKQEGSSLYLRAGDTMMLEHLLYGLMLRSGNDAAMAIAEHVGGSVEGFVHMMNEKAAMLGLTHTHFQNPSGLDAPEHGASAYDLARLTAYGLKHPAFQKIVQTKSMRVPSSPYSGSWVHKHKLLFRYPGADGVKTGYTKLAKRTLITSATRGSQQIVVVTLNDANDWRDHTVLLDAAFARYPLVTFVQRGEEVLPYGTIAARTAAYPLAPEEHRALSQRTVAPRAIDAAFGVQHVLEVLLHDQVIARVPLLAHGVPLWKEY
jgi:D-alanyl-D-alanine carboxypeptidase